MNFEKINLIFFSPTRTTQKVLKGLAAGFPGAETTSFDLTYPDSQCATPFSSDELAIIGVPVYAGRVAPVAADRLKMIAGNNTPAVVVVVYGNREYEDALIELRNIVEHSGFKPLAACTFIGEHSYSEEKTPIATGRPDEEDILGAQQYGRQILEYAENISGVDMIDFLEVPGNEPYKDGVGNFPFSPVVNVELCTSCQECIPVCPTGAISLKDEVKIDIETCIFCCSCKKTCPESALSIEARPLQEKMVWLSQNCNIRKEPQIFFPES